MDVATISILTIIIGCVLGLIEWVRVVKSDAGIMAAQIRTLETKVEHLEEKLNELKSETESIEAIVHKAVEEKIVNEKILALIQEKLKIQESNLPIKK